MGDLPTREEWREADERARKALEEADARVKQFMRARALVEKEVEDGWLVASFYPMGVRGKSL